MGVVMVTVVLGIGALTWVLWPGLRMGIQIGQHIQRSNTPQRPRVGVLLSVGALGMVFALGVGASTVYFSDLGLSNGSGQHGRLFAPDDDDDEDEPAASAVRVEGPDSGAERDASDGRDGEDTNPSEARRAADDDREPQQRREPGKHEAAPKAAPSQHDNSGPEPPSTQNAESDDVRALSRARPGDDEPQPTPTGQRPEATPTPEEPTPPDDFDPYEDPSWIDRLTDIVLGPFTTNDESGAPEQPPPSSPGEGKESMRPDERNDEDSGNLQPVPQPSGTTTPRDDDPPPEKKPLPPLDRDGQHEKELSPEDM